MQYTENYQFRKPVIGVDVADIKDMNFNSDKTDALIHNTQISLAPAYDLNETYNTGDVVMYETLMYKCKEDNVTGAWVPEKWERTTAGEEGAGGGTSVVPNPQGEPTDTLRTIGIDGTVYDIAGSSGGSGGITDEVIFTDTAGTIGTRNITLTKSLNNFDAIYFEWFGTSEEQYTSSHMSPVYPIEANDNGNVSVVCYPTYGNRYILLTGDPTSTSVSLASGTWDTVPLSVYKIHGLKFGGGSSGGRTEDVLFEKPYLTANPNTITLNHAFTDYDEIQFWTVKKDDGGYYDYLPVNIVPVEYLTDVMAGTISGRTNVINISGWQPMSQFLRISVTSASELAVVANNNNLLIRKITGIKH